MKIIKAIAGSVFLGLVCFGTGSQASTKELDLEVFRLIVNVKQYDLNTRRELARLANGYWRSFDSRVPRNSPATEEWLQGELASNDSKRLSRAINSREYALSRLTSLSKACLSFSSFLIASVGTPVELYAWLKILHCYADPQGTVDYLKLAGLSNGRFDGDFSLLHTSTFHDAITGRLADEVEMTR